MDAAAAVVTLEHEDEGQAKARLGPHQAPQPLARISILGAEFFCSISGCGLGVAGEGRVRAGNSGRQAQTGKTAALSFRP